VDFQQYKGSLAILLVLTLFLPVSVLAGVDIRTLSGCDQQNLLFDFNLQSGLRASDF
jgi:hypothetical protein